MRIIRFVFVFLGVVAFLIAGVAFAAEIASFVDNGKLLTKPLDQLWFEFHRNSRLLFQPAVERYLHPWVWQSVLFPLLLKPPLATAGAFAALGVVLVLIGRIFRRR